MQAKSKKPTFIDKVFSDVLSLLELYNAKIEDEAQFQEDLHTTLSGGIKESFKNGIQAGMRRKAGRKASQQSRRNR